MQSVSRISLLVLCGLGVWGCHSGSAQSVGQESSVLSAKAPESTGGKQARRSVKVATDAEASKIVRAAKDTTIEDIVRQSVPKQLSTRAEPFETSTWRVKATLTSVQLMKDGDFYLVMKGDKGGQTVVEVPDPKECAGSPLQSDIAAARKQIEDRYHPTKDVQKIDQPATVTGVGFLGWGSSSAGSKKKAGGSRSGPRLMPGTGFSFGP